MPVLSTRLETSKYRCSSTERHDYRLQPTDGAPSARTGQQQAALRAAGG
jgi:hypothetical protein